MTLSYLEQYYREKILGLKTEIVEEPTPDEIFKKLCRDKVKLEKLSSVEIISQEKFFDIVSRISKMYPLVFLPKFINDFVQGKSSTSILAKYHLINHAQLKYLTEYILKLEGNRERKFSSTVVNLNLENPKWKEIFEFILKNSDKFNEEISHIFNKNLLRAIIILYSFNKSEGVTVGDIASNFDHVLESCISQLNILKDKELLYNIKTYAKNNPQNDIKGIVDDLVSKNFATKTSDMKSKIILRVNSKTILDAIINILESSPDGIPYDSFQKKLMKEIPLLYYIPCTGTWEHLLEDLEKEEVLIRIRTYWRYSPYRDQLFSSMNFQKKKEEMRQQIATAGRTAFFGRKIKPLQLISELEQLDKGTLDDKDDQVTRLAGMVLASSNLPQAPKEYLKEFDFVTDISNYNFSPTEITAMKKLNVVIIGNMIHVKVMLNERIDKLTITRIKKNIPAGHQAIIFTFKEVPKSVINSLPDDKSIQILGRDAIMTWSEIRPVMPCRVNSIAKGMYGNLRNKLVRVDVIDYETGIASISTILLKQEFTVPIGSLSEIWISNCNVREYDEYVDRYEEFLGILLGCSDNNMFESGIFDTNIKTVEYAVSYPGMKPNLKTVELAHTEEISAFIPKSGVPVEWHASSVSWIFKFNDITTKISYDMLFDDFVYRATNVNSDMRYHFQCSCFYWEKITYSFKLCSHMIKALDFMAKRMNCFNHTWTDINTNIISRLLYIFVVLNKFSSIDVAAFSFTEEYFQMFLSYLGKISCRDWSPTDENISIANSIKQDLSKQYQNVNDFTILFAKIEESAKETDKETMMNIISEIEHEYESQRRRSSRH